MYSRAKRLFDLCAACAGLVVLAPLFLFCMLAIRLTSPGPIFYISDRIGVRNSHFMMLKFRTMRVDTPQVATHLMTDPTAYLTPVGAFFRKTSLDELPQLINVFKGEMSIVGPRPALFNQHDLIELRTQKGVHVLTPGLTGWAQVNGRDELPIPIKVEYDAYYLQHRSFLLDIKITLQTLLKALRREGVHH
ncbi:MAG: sugar transferase [Candidatus Electrothrix sp. GM3_4]|nr:sugar transferase [Candidatus Electrothrix sp. GM3_4]